MFGKPENNIDLKDYVLEKINNDARNTLNEAIEKATKAVEEILLNGIDIAMNKFN